MKHFTNREISEIRENLNNGVVYCGIRNGAGTGYITVSSDLQWIRWNHYGSSANENTDRDLRWMLETIFDDCETVVPAEYSRYHINYIPIDKQYRGIDLSMRHPNVCGL